MHRLDAISESSRLAKEQEKLHGGRFLGDLAQITLPALTTRLARAVAGTRLFDKMRPPFNVTVSSVRVPDVSLFCAGSRVVDMYPVGPMAPGIGINVTAFSYLGRVYFGLLACRKLLPELDEVAVHIDDALGELVVRALDAAGRHGLKPRRRCLPTAERRAVRAAWRSGPHRPAVIGGGGWGGEAVTSRTWTPSSSRTTAGCRSRTEACRCRSRAAAHVGAVVGRSRCRNPRSSWSPRRCPTSPSCCSTRSFRLLVLVDGVVVDELEVALVPELPVVVEVVAALATNAPPVRSPALSAPTASTLRRRICMGGVPFRLV